MSFANKLNTIVKKHEELGEKLNSPDGMDGKEFAKLSKEYAGIGALVEKIREYQAALQQQKDAEELFKDAGADAEMKEMIEQELQELKKSVPAIEHEIKLMMLPKDAADEKNVILEIRAGTGGDEAAIFAGDLLNMYQRYADSRGWKVEMMSASDSDKGGFKEVICSISGNNVFERLKFESGVHRVQRVPDTETQGRVHTSAATVAVLPEAEDIDIQIEEKDLRIDVFRSSGPGGQSVNTTDSAVRITHIPSGLVVSQQDEKSQHKNKAKALRILKTRLYDHQREMLDKARAADRKSQVGSGDRSERIRTYNYPQSRISDHRINLTVYNLPEVVDEGALDPIINALIAEDQAAKLSSTEI